MPWVEVCFSVDREDVAAAERCLEELGALAVTLEDEADHPVLEPGPGETPLWPTVQLRGLFESGLDRERVLTDLAAVPGGERPGAVRVQEVGDRDWARAWMDRFRPMCFGTHLWIVPTGMSIKPDPSHIEIRLDPGLAFGTGTHPTTALCLEWLDAQDLTGYGLVDYGCGSGILSVAAALKGAEEVMAVDNDPQALEATSINARRNAVDRRISAVLPDDCHTRNADVVLANILAGPLIELAAVIAGCARPGGKIVLSGLLSEQVDGVVAAYPDCEIEDVVTREGWARVEMHKL
ncbi:MAG: 50S ribosomal protein L11 methyltransferase [Xanthomonadales bacterium]|nr:50S ribosomal protein L11 methyltransferase [Gammaproteobacteria bacterium]MBT8051368.1 50S ribosomal protein L11 methyltransferase [Gammaproteobacteria bacterium]MBT8056930.1 50S ribosomal protein L11 methyltransferase [Gammaproteobacteria bacterium]NNJ78879.1 50S ribosomal protein L11 methyltransferase [Xanthomonadales bacterium]NNL05950.1 50S ribosomal protein L11 methyltransferase [Xanthomonadales bacterium]